jgi:benzoyl-CoA reductase/2-hydroxyglutaryl-CoA dehydratase subunit BcrC/BadD/HgdB
MELIKRTVITPVSENLSPITVSVQRNDIGEFMLVINQNLGKDTIVTYTNSRMTVNEWYSEKIAETKKSLIFMEQPFSVKEYAD